MNCLRHAVPELTGLPWHALRTKSNFEQTTTTVLNCKGYECYLPMYTVRRRWSDRVVKTSLPLFPGYVFCRFDSNLRGPILSTPGVICIIGFGNEPAEISDHEIEAVRAVLRFGLTAEPCSFFQEGQLVRIVRGPLEGIEGTLVKKKSEWRLIVSVTMLQRSVSVEIDREDITAIR